MTPQEARYIHLKMLDYDGIRKYPSMARSLAKASNTIVSEELSEVVQDMLGQPQDPNEWIFQYPPSSHGLMFFKQGKRWHLMHWFVVGNRVMVYITFDLTVSVTMFGCSFKYDLPEEETQGVASIDIEEPFLYGAENEEETTSVTEHMWWLAQYSWAMMKQTIVVSEPRSAPVSLPGKKSKAKIKGDINIVHLRKKESRRKSDESRPVEWSCRWPVRSHWARQPYGENNSKRKMVLRPMTIKGPQDKPFRARAQINWLDR